ncbi:MAG: hypothetical protein Q7V56_16795 [Gammaproteobacteria bacterium]|nr:hypothetical protein [Gammaproteobacteria bacterium]
MTPKRKTLVPALIVIALLALVVNYQVNREREDSMSKAVTAGPGQESGVSDASTTTTITDSGSDSIVIPSQQAAGDQAVSEPASGSSNNKLPDSSVDTSRSSVADANLSSQRPDSSKPALSDRVFYVIEEAQKRQLEDQWEEALNELNALYLDFDSLNPFEQATLLNFYTNTLIRLEMWQESISAFALMLTVEDLRPDINARALLALGQLHAKVNEVPVATAYYEEWLEFTRGMDGLEAQTARVEQQLNSLESPYERLIEF